MFSGDPNSSLSDRCSHRIQILMDRLGEMWMTIISPFEWLVRSFIDLLFKISEAFERIDSLFLGISWLARRCVSGIGNVCAFLVQTLIPRPVQQMSACALEFTERGFSALRRAGDWLIQALNLDRFVGLLVWLLKPVWLPPALLLGFLHAWFVTRAWKKLLWALPAIVLILPFVLVAARITLWGSKDLANPYRLALQESLAAKDYDKAEIYERKLAQMNIDTRLSAYQKADNLARDGKLTEAYARMQKLAPAEEPGYPAAHGWILNKLMAQELGLTLAESERLIALHLGHLDTLGFRGDRFNMIRASLLIQKNQLAEADKLLEPISRVSASAALERLRIHLKLKDTEAARNDARTIRSLLSSRTGHTEGLTTTQYSWWAAAEELLGDQQRLARVLELWLANTPDNQKARKMLAAIKRDEYLLLLKNPVANPDEVVNLLHATLAVDDDPSWLDQNVHELVELQSTLPLAKKVLNILAIAPQTPASVLEKLGSYAAVAGDLDVAESCFERALEKDSAGSASAGMWNNLAWTRWKKSLAAEGSNEELNEALTAADRALKLHPDEFRYRETRGQILISLKKWEPAIVDLEFALNGMPDHPEIHQALASAYEALDNDDLAQIHRQLTRKGSF